MAEDRVRNTKSNQSASRLDGEFWLLVPLGLVGLLCVYAIAQGVPALGYLGSSPLSILLEPVLAALLMLAFALAFSLKVLRRAWIGKIASIVAFVITGFLGFALLWALFRLASPCTGFFGVPTSCIEMHYFYTWLIFFNPISASVLSVLSAVGLVALFLKK